MRIISPHFPLAESIHFMMLSLTLFRREGFRSFARKTHEFREPLFDAKHIFLEISRCLENSYFKMESEQKTLSAVSRDAENACKNTKKL